YRRFGYGVATRYRTVRLDATRADLVADLDEGAIAEGTLRLLDAVEAAEVLPRVWDRHWRRTPGELDRTPGFWDAVLADPEAGRDGASARFTVVHETAGDPDGFATYRIR